MRGKFTVQGRSCSLPERLAWLFVALALMPVNIRSSEKNFKLVPELRSGQVLRYEIHGRVEQYTKTKSPVTKYSVPRDVKQDFSAVLRINITQVDVVDGKPLVSAQSEFEYPDKIESGSTAAQKHPVEFTLDSKGQVKRVAGLDDLETVEQIAWQFWIAQFAFGWTIAGRNVKAGETWKSEEPVSAPAPIARLVWERQTTVGDNGKCAVDVKEDCTAFLTTAWLKQKSSPADATPEDFRLNNLKTSGMVSGKNETYDSISEQTGLLMRGTEDVKQSMDVQIAKADASNSVSYTMEAGSHFEMVLLVPGAGEQ
jgi:hypothetical protein